MATFTEQEKLNQQTHDIEKRAGELHNVGYDWLWAIKVADFENWVRHWPEEWGNNLYFLVYGDFDPPSQDLYFPESGITLYSMPLENSHVRSVNCVLRASVTVTERAPESVRSAMRKISVFSGLLALSTWGCPIGWHPIRMIEPIRGRWGETLGDTAVEESINRIEQLSERVKLHITSALYWIYEAHYPTFDYRPDEPIKVYAAYWNAFESLTEAINKTAKRKSLSRSDKQKKIDELITEKNGCLTPSDIEKLYKQIINPGFRDKASHALRVCFPRDAKKYIYEFFERPDKENRLYQIRNDINHGTIDGQDPIEKFRIESRFEYLRVIVWNMFSPFIPMKVPHHTLLRNR